MMLLSDYINFNDVINVNDILEIVIPAQRTKIWDLDGGYGLTLYLFSNLTFVWIWLTSAASIEYIILVILSS